MRKTNTVRRIKSENVRRVQAMIDEAALTATREKPATVIIPRSLMPLDCSGGGIVIPAYVNVLGEPATP